MSFLQLLKIGRSKIGKNEVQVLRGDTNTIT